VDSVDVFQLDAEKEPCKGNFQDELDFQNEKYLALKQNMAG